MTARAEYTAEEWLLLITAPQAVIGAMAFADGAGLLEVATEAVVAAVTQSQGKERYDGNELVAALIDNKERVEPARLPQPQVVGESAESVRDRLRSLALDQCRAAMRLLAERSNGKEAGGYAAWVMDSAKAAASARRHRDRLFAPAGPLVGPEERDLLEEIGRALGVEVGELPMEGEQAARSGFPAPGPDQHPEGSIPPPDTIPRGVRGGSDFPSGPLDPS